MAAVLTAAKATAQLLLLAAVCLPAFANIPRTPLVAEKPHLGSVSFVLASHRAESVANSLIAPGFSECLYDSGTRPCCSGKERDAETGLDYFGARYMSSAQGRFMGADAPFADQDAVDPQSWRLYSYTRNNPLRFVDDDGRGVLDGAKNFVNHTGSAFVRAVLEPEKFFPQVAKGISDRLSDPAKLATDIGAAVENFSNASPDEKATVITEVVLDIGLAAITGGASRGGSLVTVGKVEVKEGVIKPSLKTLANEIRESGNHNASRNQRTVAVAEDSKGGLHVASSNGLDSGQKKAAAAKGVKCVKCKKGSHAEENIMREVQDARRIGTSKRQPCGPSEHNCAAQLAERGIIVEE